MFGVTAGDKLAGEHVCVASVRGFLKIQFQHPDDIMNSSMCHIF